MNSKYIRLTLIISLLVGLLAYLALINFSLPFMTTDEISYLHVTTQYSVTTTLSSGRYSGLIGMPIVTALAFSNPDFVHLLPRFFSMLLLAFVIILIIRNLGFSVLEGVVLGVFILMTHELDWQHNGLVAFFGAYNILLAAFMLAFLLNEKEMKSNWAFTFIMVLLIGSYASELFVGLSLCYLVLRIIINRQVRFMARSPFFWSLTLYGTAYLCIKAFTILNDVRAKQMSNYLVGALDAYRVDQIVTAALLYFINSLPYYHQLAVPASMSVMFSTIILILIVGSFIKLSIGLKKKSKINSEIIVFEKEWLLGVMLFLLAVAPNALMALQPTKVDWILRNASVHYAFSYYTWIGLAIVCAYFVKQNMRRAGSLGVKVLSLVLVSIMLGVSVFSISHNIDFANEYKSSRTKWVHLNEILSTNMSKEVVIPPSYLQHPYISVVSPVQMKVFAKKYYDVQLRICSIVNEIKLDEEVSEKIVQLDGFSVIEGAGRWTEGAISTIQLVAENPRINFVELEISSVFYENGTSSVVITKGNKKFRYKIEGIGKSRFDLTGLNEGRLQIQFLIAKPISPFKLGLSADTRNLGLMVKNIKFGFKDSSKHENLYAMELCY